MGVFFEALFGSGVSTAVPGQSGVYQHVFTPATTEPLPAYTIQKGIPTLGGGATTPMTFNGSVCKSGEISASNGDIVKLKTAWDAKEVKTDVAYAAPSYAANLELLTFVHGSIRVGGTVVNPTNDGAVHGRHDGGEHRATSASPGTTRSTTRASPSATAASAAAARSRSAWPS